MKHVSAYNNNNNNNNTSYSTGGTDGACNGSMHCDNNDTMKAIPVRNKKLFKNPLPIKPHKQLPQKRRGITITTIIN